MATNATEFRRNLFHMLDCALRGEVVEITYRGEKLRIAAAARDRKLARVVRRPGLPDPDGIVESDAALMSKLKRKWEKQAAQL